MKRYIDADKLFAYVDGQTHLSKGKVMNFIRKNETEGEIARWISPAVELPIDPDEVVLVRAFGKCKNITLENAVELATYSDEKGWILENYPEDEVMVSGWLYIPGRDE